MLVLEHQFSRVIWMCRFRWKYQLYQFKAMKVFDQLNQRSTGMMYGQHHSWLVTKMNSSLGWWSRRKYSILEWLLMSLTDKPERHHETFLSLNQTYYQVLPWFASNFCISLRFCIIRRSRSCTYSSHSSCK